MQVSIAVKKYFFDRPEVVKAIGRASTKALSDAGAKIRTTARQLIRSAGKKHKSSKPGEPPRNHAGKAFASLKTIFFAYDPAKRSVVVGPIKLNGKKSTAVPIPSILEFGGTEQTTEILVRGKWLHAARPITGKQHSRSRSRTATYAARPYMNPALEKNLPVITNTFKDSLRAT